MKEKMFYIAPLILFQKVSWVVFFGLFAAATVMGLLDIPYARELADASVIGLLVVTFSKTFLFAHQFRRAGLNQYYLLSLVLALVLLSTIALNYWLP